MASQKRAYRACHNINRLNLVRPNTMLKNGYVESFKVYPVDMTVPWYTDRELPACNRNGNPCVASDYVLWSAGNLHPPCSGYRECWITGQPPEVCIPIPDRLVNARTNYDVIITVTHGAVRK